MGGANMAFTEGRLHQSSMGSTTYTAVFDVPRQPASLTGTVIRRDDEACCYDLAIGGCTFHLGLWWLEAAARGALGSLPVVNTNPTFALAPKTEEAPNTTASCIQAPMTEDCIEKAGNTSSS